MMMADQIKTKVQSLLDEQLFSLVRDAYTDTEFIHVELDRWKIMLDHMDTYKRLARLPKEWVDDLPDGEFSWLLSLPRKTPGVLSLDSSDIPCTLQGINPGLLLYCRIPHLSYYGWYSL